jgi:hypothetical protein
MPVGQATKYILNPSGIFLDGICAGSDGRLWLSEQGGSVWAVTTLGVPTAYTLPSSPGPGNICLGSDGNVWILGTLIDNNTVTRVTPAGVATSFSFGGSPWGEAFDICTGSDGRLWVTTGAAPSTFGIWAITTSGTATQYTFGNSVRNICPGPDGNLWVTSPPDAYSTANEVWRVTTAGVATAFTLATVGGFSGYDNADAICAGSDGNLWVTGMYGVWQVTTAGASTYFPIANFSLNAYAGMAICPGPDGNLWAAGGYQAFQITTAGVATPFTLSGAYAIGICPGPDGNLWVADSTDGPPYAGSIGMVADTATPLSPTLGFPNNAAAAELATTPTFTWMYANTDGSSQAGWAFRMKIAGAANYSYWNLSTLAWQSTIVWNTGGVGSYTFPAASFVDGNIYNWSVATQSTWGLQGIFATDFSVTAQVGPVVTVTGPTGIFEEVSTAPVVTWTAAIPGGASQIAWQVRTFSIAQYNAVGFLPSISPATDDSGVTSGSATSYQVQTALPPTTYQSYVAVTETGPLTSGWTAYTSYLVAVDEPATPSLTAVVSTDPATGVPVISLAVQGIDNLLSAVDASFETGLGSWT